MYLRLINVKAIERQRDSYILVINNRYEKMGESLYRINKDALEIIRNLSFRWKLHHAGALRFSSASASVSDCKHPAAA